MKNRKGFTMIELMVVILIVGILAAVAVPLMRGKVDQAKWSEAASAAGAIRSANRAYFAEKGSGVTGALTAAKALQLGFQAGDFDGGWFVVTDYSIGAVDSYGFADVSATSSNFTGFTGTLDSSGWAVTAD